MVTSFYIMNLHKNRAKRRSEDLHSKLFNVSSVPCNDAKSKCRVCLQKGSVPIFGIKEDIPRALSMFGDLQVSRDDEFPKFLCDMCYKFIKSAILFRKIAKQSEETLKKPMKKEIYFCQDNDISDCENEIEVGQQRWDTNISHIKLEKKEKEKLSPKVTCDVCKKIMNRSYIKEHLTMHQPDHHKYVCEVCGKSFRLRCAYHNHRLRHRSDFPFKCQFCPYRGRYSELLKTHMRTHTGDYRYMCTECPARFLFKSNLNSHMQKHKQPKFKCDNCKRSFHTKLMLQRHFEADHLGIKNHVCSVCGKAFGYRNAMMKHQRHVHKREKSMFGRMPAYLQSLQKQSDHNEG